MKKRIQIIGDKNDMEVLLDNQILFEKGVWLMEICSYCKW